MTCKCKVVGIKDSLRVMALRDGGFVVFDDTEDRQRPMLAAFSKLDEALEYIRIEMGGERA